MASPTQWIWVWVNSGSWWWTGRPDVLRFTGSQRVGHDWVTELEMEWITLGIFIARSLSVIFFCFHCVHQANLQYIYCIHWSSTRGHLVPLPFWGTLAPYPRVGPGKSCEGLKVCASPKWNLSRQKSRFHTHCVRKMVRELWLAGSTLWLPLDCNFGSVPKGSGKHMESCHILVWISANHFEAPKYSLEGCVCLFIQMQLGTDVCVFHLLPRLSVDWHGRRTAKW